MFDNPPDDRPLALRDLAQTESPEIVRAALGRFRRRLLTRGLILALIVATGLFLYPRYVKTDRELPSEMQHARGVTVLRSIQDGSIEASIERAARLPSETLAPGRPIERFGIQLSLSTFIHSDQPGTSIVPPGGPTIDEQLVITAAPTADNGLLQVWVRNRADYLGGLDVWVSVVGGTRTIDLPVAGVLRHGDAVSLAHPHIGTIHIDMQKLGIPDWVWR